MKVKENEGLKELLEDCSKGEWSTPFDGWEFGWSLETESENTYMTIGTNRGPVAIAGVESAFGKDYIVDANAALIAMAPNMAREIISLRERMDEKEADLAAWKANAEALADVAEDEIWKSGFNAGFGEAMLTKPKGEEA